MVTFYTLLTSLFCILDISVLQNTLQTGLSRSLLFIHALSGCDTTSRPYGVGKLSAIAKYEELEGCASLFLSEQQSHADIEQAGHQALATLYGCSDLNSGRVLKFTQKVISSSSYLPPERLPPTADAARFHSRRVYLQVQAWLGNNMEPTEWGWMLHKTAKGDILKPQKMEQTAAPASLLKIIRFGCSGRCDKNTCSCRKNELHCTLACGQCKGISCTNRDISDELDTE